MEAYGKIQHLRVESCLPNSPLSNARNYHIWNILFKAFGSLCSTREQQAWHGTIWKKLRNITFVMGLAQLVSNGVTWKRGHCVGPVCGRADWAASVAPGPWSGPLSCTVSGCPRTDPAGPTECCACGRTVSPGQQRETDSMSGILNYVKRMWFLDAFYWLCLFRFHLVS